MIAYTMYGTNDLTRSTAFYDEVMKELGYVRTMSGDTFAAWGEEGTPGVFCVTKPFDGNEATAGNGTMLALGVTDTAVIDRAHARALQVGGTDEGAPGIRESGTFYMAYFRDPDGNKVAMCAQLGEFNVTP